MPKVIVKTNSVVVGYDVEPELNHSILDHYYELVNPAGSPEPIFGNVRLLNSHKDGEDGYLLPILFHSNEDGDGLHLARSGLLMTYSLIKTMEKDIALNGKDNTIASQNLVLDNIQAELNMYQKIMEELTDGKITDSRLNITLH